MNCEAVLNVEDLYTEGRLSPARMAMVRAHLKDCPACAARLKSDPLSGKGRAVTAPKDLKERMRRMLAEVKPEESAKPAPSFSLDSEAWPVVATIAVYLGIALVLSW